MATVWNMALMSKFCQAWNRWQHLIRIVRRNGHAQKNPLRLVVVSDGSLTAACRGRGDIVVAVDD